MWIATALSMLSLPFLSLPGRYVNDTRDALWLAPNTYLSHALQLWRNNPVLGFEQHDGIAFPMGVGVWALHAVGLPTWAAERIWHGALLFGACAFTILLIDHLRGRRTVLAPLLAGLIYALTPFAFGYGLPFTGTFLPYVLLPLLLLIVMIGVTRRGFVWPALFGLVTLLMGGGNGAPQVYALIACGLLLGWIAVVDRGVTVRRALTFGGLALAFAVGINASNLFLLSSGEIANALTFSEVPKVINVDSSAAESIRGLGFWLFYGADHLGPWVPTVRAYITQPLLIMAGFAIPVAAVAAAWRSRWRYRLFFVLLALLAVVVLGGIFPADAPTPFGRALLWAYAHVPGAGGLRTTYKFGAALSLSFALLIGMGVDHAMRRIGRMPRARLARICAVGAAFIVVSANAFPLWTGHLYPVRNSTADLPGYWQRALADLDRDVGQGRAFFAPGTGKADYRWGFLKEGVVAAIPELPAVAPSQVPVGSRYGSNLLKALERPYVDGTGYAAFSTLLRYLGVSEVVLQNDLNWRTSQTPRPATLHGLVRSPGLSSGRSYGRPGQNVLVPTQPSHSTVFDRFEATLPPVQVLRVQEPLPIVRAEPSAAAILSGDGFGLSAAAGVGLLERLPPVLYSGTLTEASLMEALARDPHLVITDSNRRRVWTFTTPQGRSSATLQAGRTVGGRPTGFALFGNRPSTQSVAVYPGMRAITASTDAGPLGSTPQFRPGLAFDGDPTTWWAIPTGDPIGSWIEATFSRPRLLSRISITLPPAATSRPIERVTISLAPHTKLHAALRAGGTTTVQFLRAQATGIRVTIDEVAPGADASKPPAIADISIPGTDPAELVRVPTDLFDTAASTPGGLAALGSLPVSYVFERARTGSSLDRDEERGIDRRFDVAAPTAFVLGGSGHLDRSASDQAIDQMVYGSTPVTVTSSSRLGGDPRFRGSSAFDENGLTEWSPQGSIGQWLQLSFPSRRVGTITVATDPGPGRLPILAVRAALSDGTILLGRLQRQDGIITLSFPPRALSSIRLTVVSVFSPERGSTLPVGIRNVTIPGARPFAAPGAEDARCVSASASLDGAPLLLRLDGTIQEVLVGKNLPIVTCHGSTIGLGAGVHNLRMGGALQPDAVTLSSEGTATPGPTMGMPAITWRAPADGRFLVSVLGARRPFYLTIGQNYSPRWRATIGHASLGAPQVLDGYSAGWLVERTGSYTIDVSYGPQRVYAAAVAVSGLSLLTAFGVLGGAVLRRRRGR